jgi:hypothetical protein
MQRIIVMFDHKDGVRIARAKTSMQHLPGISVATSHDLGCCLCACQPSARTTSSAGTSTCPVTSSTRHCSRTG